MKVDMALKQRNQTKYIANLHDTMICYEPGTYNTKSGDNIFVHLVYSWSKFSVPLFFVVFFCLVFFSLEERNPFLFATCIFTPDKWGRMEQPKNCTDKNKNVKKRLSHQKHLLYTKYWSCSSYSSYLCSVLANPLLSFDMREKKETYFFMEKVTRNAH